MKKNYINPEFELLSFNTEDIMNTSSELLPDKLGYAKEGGLEDSDKWIG